ncbi:MAG TPA: MmcQ/YjbR family DNA-binding protein [Acidimicrobiales bacterium]
MATQDDVRRIALSLPETSESEELFAFAVRRRGFAWGAIERPDPKGPRVPNPDVIAVRVADDDEKRALIAAAPDRYFSGHPFNGIHTVQVRLPAIDDDELTELLTDAWRTQAPKALVRDFDRLR